MTDTHHVAVEIPPPGEAPTVSAPRRGRAVGVGTVFVFVLLSALVGAGAAVAVARATGWGAETVVTRYVANGSSIAEKPADIQGLLVAVLPTVVSVTATSTQSNQFFGYGPSRTVTAEGTGIIVTSSGQLITNDHVVNGATSVTVTLNGTQKALPATVVGADSTRDLALLKISGVSGLPVASFGDSSKVVPGDGVIAVGFALGLTGGPTVTAGIISATGREVSTQTATGATETLTGMLQTDAPISSGNSGGPLVNSSGKVVGINTLVATSTGQNTASSIGFAIAANSVTALLPTLRTGG